MRTRTIAAAPIVGAAFLLALSGAAHPAEDPGGSGGSMSLVPTPTVPNPDRPVRTTSGKVVVSRDAALPPALGPNPCKVLVTVYSDFQCPVCARATDATHQISEEWPGQVRVEFRQHPLAMHANAENAAVASLAAHQQGKFWEYHDVLFAHQSALDAASLETYAREIGLDLTRFRKDYADPKLRARVKDEGALADRLGATGTPAFLVNGRLSVGWGSWQSFRAQVEQELAAVDALLAKHTPLADVLAVRAKANAANGDAFAAYKAAVIDPLARARGHAAPK